jgi:hypothetical protein
MALSIRRRVGRSRRLVRDTGAILQLVIAVVMLTQGIRSRHRPDRSLCVTSAE